MICRSLIRKRRGKNQSFTRWMYGKNNPQIQPATRRGRMMVKGLMTLFVRGPRMNWRASRKSHPIIDFPAKPKDWCPTEKTIEPRMWHCKSTFGRHFAQKLVEYAVFARCSLGNPREIKEKRGEDGERENFRKKNRKESLELKPVWALIDNAFS